MKTLLNSMGINTFFILAIIAMFGLIFIPNYNHIKERLGFDTVESVKKDLNVQKQVVQSLSDENTHLKDDKVIIGKIEVINVDTRLATDTVRKVNKSSFKKIAKKITDHENSDKAMSQEQIDAETLALVVIEVHNAYTLAVTVQQGA